MLHPVPTRRPVAAVLASSLALGVSALTLSMLTPVRLQAQAADRSGRTAPIWPDPALDRRYQCEPGSRTVSDFDAASLDPSRVAVTRWLPGVIAAQRDGGCLSLTVDGPGSGRLAALVLRGVGVPDRVVRVEVVRMRLPRA